MHTAEEVPGLILRVHNALLLYYPPVLIAFGTVGNVLTLFVMLQRQNRRMSTCLYMAALALIGTLILWGMYFSLWLIRNFLPNASSPYLCKSMTFFEGFLQDLSTWTLVAMTSERVVAIAMPLKRASWCTVARARNTLIILPLIVAGKNIHLFWTTNLFYSPEAQSYVCDYISGKDFVRIYTWVDSVISSILPFLMLLVSNIIIVVIVKSAIKLQISSNRCVVQSRNGARDNIRSTQTNARDQQLTFKLVSVNVLFLTLSLPYFVVRTYWSNVAIEDQSLFLISFRITQCLWYTNSATYFYVYCILGSKFRKDLRYLFSCCYSAAGRPLPYDPSIYVHSSSPQTESKNASSNNLSNSQSIARSLDTNLNEAETTEEGVINAETAHTQL